MTLSKKQVADFQAIVWGYYAQHQRAMPWRQDTNPYFVWVSELMLQQTQVDRVVPKFLSFITEFPTITALAQAPLSAVLQAWVGLGYNRRAKYLHAAAQQIEAQHNGKLPHTYEALVLLPGIGPNTAGAILAYAFNQPVTYIETNIRSVFIHHFFADDGLVGDPEIRELVAATIAVERPREWYWALMDYGVYVKKTFGNNIRRSKQYRKQSKFSGSLREIRGKVIALLAERPVTMATVVKHIKDERVEVVLQQLQQEGFIIIQGNRVQLAE